MSIDIKVDEFDRAIDKLVQYNSMKFNFRKAAEELTELATVLLQHTNKSEKPSDQSIIDEIGDVVIRLSVVADYFPENALTERVNNKLKKLSGYLKENKYKNV